MKKDTHPKYYNDTVITCLSCNATYETGSVKEKMNTEICGACHPFYTGKHRILDSTGRVEKFNKKYAQFFKGSDESSKTKNTTKEEAVEDSSDKTSEESTDTKSK